MLTFEEQSCELEERIEHERQAQRELLSQRPSLRDEDRRVARREALEAERIALAALQSEGTISESVYRSLVAEVDAALADVGSTD